MLIVESRKAKYKGTSPAKYMVKPESIRGAMVESQQELTH